MVLKDKTCKNEKENWETDKKIMNPCRLKYVHTNLPVYKKGTKVTRTLR